MPLSLVRVFSMTPDTSSLTSASFFPGALLMSWFDNLMIVVVVMMVDDDEIFQYHGWELWIMIIFWTEELVYRRQYRECGTKSQETSSPHKAARQGIREWDEQEPWRSGIKLPDRIFWVWRNKAETSWETTFAARCFRWYWTGNQTMTKTRTRSKVKQSAMVWKLRCWTQRFFLTHFSDLYSTMWVMLLLTFKLPWSLRRCLGLGIRNAIATMRNMQISSHQFIVYQFINL